jgi:DUF4097 and DUF4098 domain-containing protein YvlB
MNRQGLRPLVLAVTFAASVASAGCVVTVDSSEYTAREEKRFEVRGEAPEVTLVTFDGSMEIRSWDQAVVQVEVEKRGPNKEVAEAIKVTAEQTGNTIRLEVKRPTGEVAGFLRQSPSARIVALVPRKTKVAAQSGDGSITVERIEGDVDVDTGDGSVRGYSLAGNLRVHTGDGSVRLENVDGSIVVDTADGTVAIDGRLRALKVVTGDGTVSVRADEGSVMADAWEIRTGDGGVRLELPADFAADLDASTADGRVRLRGLEGEPEPDEPRHDPDEERARRDVKRSLGGGGKLLRVRSGSGSITVTGI